MSHSETTFSDSEVQEIVNAAFEGALGEELLLYIMRALFDAVAVAGVVG